MCLLEDALATIPLGSRCFIEIKVGAEATPGAGEGGEGLRKVEGAAVRHQLPGGCRRSVEEALPEIPAYYLSSFKQNKETGEWSPKIEEILDTARRIKADGVDLSYKGPIDAALVRKVREAGWACTSGRSMTKRWPGSWWPWS